MEVLALLAQPCWFVSSLVLAMALCWLRRRQAWEPRTCRVDLSGKTAVVTGASSGIGKCVALDLASRNARTLLACRSRERGQAALEEIRRATGNANVHLRIVDTSSMASVRDFARQLLEEERRLDILVNNAGATGLPHRVTPEGLELLFATNFLGPFLLTNLLLDLMKASAPARIVNVSSFRHRVGEVNIKLLTGEEQTNFDQAYSSTKLMNMTFTVELARRLQGTGVSVMASNPGIVRTGITRHFSGWVRLLFALCGPFLKTPRQGAASTLYCAVSQEAHGITGKYVDSDCSLRPPAASAQDPALGRQLWDASAQLTGLGDGGRDW